MKLPPGHVAGRGVAQPKCTGGFGERMLRSMGWHAGEGLGKEGTGIKEAIQVKKKEDTVGVGGNGSYAWGDKWWEKAFDSAVATVGDSDSSDSSDSDSDDEHMAAIAAAVNRDGTRTSASADELKLLASLSKGGRLAAGRFGGRDAKMARIREQEARLAAEAAAKLGVPSGPSAATGGTTAATTGGTAVAGGPGGASDASETTSEVKLSAGKGGGSGGNGGSSKTQQKKEKRKSSAGEPRGDDDGQPASGKEGGGKRKKAKGDAPADQQQQQADGAQQQQGQGQGQGQQLAKKQRIVIEPVVAYLGPQYDFKPTPATGWWGEKRFHSVGCLEGLDKQTADAAKQRMTFNEDDQARIYNAAQAKKTQGKVGLGQGTGTVKVGGVKWEGKRVTFEQGAEEGGGDAEDAAAAAAAAGEGRGRLTAIGSSTHLADLAGGGEHADEQQQQQQQREGQQTAAAKPRSNSGGKAAAVSGGQEQQQQQQAQQADVGGWEASVKWKKIISQQLAAAERQQLRLKELQRLVVAAVLQKHGAVVSSKAAVKAAFASRLESSSRFVVEGKLVRLRS